ncbi:M50 family metallopeptidase [Candidatus Woesearchaeota archaeon]|nr:M50 family metallopeptidase [Candidatus Woesearchaeota archaeon]
MLISLKEVIDIIIMTVAVGFIFMDVWRQFGFFRSLYHVGFHWRALWLGCLVTAPALIFHELMHKFTALSFGLSATFHASYFWLGFGVLLKLLHSPFLFFVPAYVSIGCSTGNCVLSPIHSAVVAFAGPFANLIIFLIARQWLKQRRLPMKKRVVLYVTKQINLFLFIFNMLPFPLFDGFKVYQGLFYFISALF